MPPATRSPILKTLYAMPKYHPNAVLSDCWSSVGDITFYHRDGECFYRQRSRCVFPGTPEQLIQADIHRRALAAWQGLDHNVQEVWNLVAMDAEPHKPPFRSGSHISGFNLFVSAYHGFARLGQEKIPQPRVWEDFPSFYLDCFSAVSMAAEPGTLVIDCRLHLTTGSAASRYRLLGQIQIVEEGKGSNPGLMRTFLAEDVAKLAESVKLCRFTVPTTVATRPCRMHSRMLLIDSASGYRSQRIECSVSL